MRIPIRKNGRQVAHLEVDVERSSDRRSGLSVLYMHGFGSSRGGEKAAFFRARALAAGLGFWALDFQGHGDSGGGMRELTLSRQLEDVARVREAMNEAGETRVVLLGSSMGGLTGLWHSALADPVEAGLYIAPALGLERAFEAWAGAEGIARWQREGVYEIANELGRWEVGWQFVEDLRGFSNDDLARRLKTPSLLLQGKLDDRVAWRDVMELAVGCDAPVELHLFGDGDHRMVDRKQHLWDLMLAFLRARGVVD